MKIFLMVTMAFLGTLAHADDSVFEPTAQSLPAVGGISMATLADSPAMQQHGDQVIAVAKTKIQGLAARGAITPQEKIQIEGWFESLPFQRIIDLELNFLSGLPDLVGICLEGNPSQFVTIDACAGTMAFISSISVHVASRFMHYVNIKGKRNQDGSISYSGHEFGFGTSVGLRHFEIINFFSAGGTATGIDTLLSAEWVYWISRYFGLSTQLSGGVTFALRREPQQLSSVIPNIKLSLGLSF